MAKPVTRDPLLLKLAGQVAGLRAVVRRSLAHIAVLDGGDIEFLKRELEVVLGEMPQFQMGGLSKRDQKLMLSHAREIIEEAYGTIAIAGETLADDGKAR